MPLVIAHHLTWTAYGTWLPNDPRGSLSKATASDAIAGLGTRHYGRKKVQPSGTEVREFRDNVADVLMYPVLKFGPREVERIAAAFGRTIEDEKYTCYACAIMPDHVHILIRKHGHEAEDMIGNLQTASRQRLCDKGCRTADHPVWGGPGWKGFLFTPQDVRRTIVYIDENPVKWRLPRQHWPFVTEYNGWPLHPGHSPNSPYAKALRAAGKYHPE